MLIYVIQPYGHLKFKLLSFTIYVLKSTVSTNIFGKCAYTTSQNIYIKNSNALINMCGSEYMLHRG